MDVHDQLVLKRTLDALRKIGTSGLTKADTLDIAELASGSPLTTEQRETLWNLLVERKYVRGHMEPVTHVERWTITERGLTAFESL